MRVFAWILITFYLIITVFWIANSPYLFSTWGVSVWLVSIVFGLITYKQVNENNFLRKLVLYSTSFMVFLLIVTGLIHLVVSSMP
ncbi:hypothetical protein [Sutcliffiella deserti]|uniref:hypothetical protein n=1 Tax=Sutcliffiella deserti TaxID=2875501 RepID=UPI001CBB84C4|nr:hypothetical protein [Sutcliffiella deserti]